MNEVEAYELFVLAADQQNQLLVGYFGVVTAFLIMSYFVAGKLDKFLAAIAVVLYSLCCAWFTLSLTAWSVDLSNLYQHMLESKAAGIYELAWFGNNPSWITQAAGSLVLVLMLGGWLISLVYFLYRRKVDEAGV